MAIYVAARDLAGAMLIGTHQFIIVIPDKAELSLHFSPPDGPPISGRRITPRDRGLVIGAHDVELGGRHRLMVEFFEEDDMQAAREFLRPNRYVRALRPDFDTEASRVTHSGSDAAFVNRLLFLIRNYMINEADNNIPYPLLGYGHNSNSWAQTVVEIAGGTVNDSNFRGFDFGHNRRIPRIYFDAICPAEPRPRLNQ